ncbi:polysaccharide lyase, partial [Natrialba taiwanensis]
GASGGHHNQGAAWSCRMNTPCQGGTYDGSDGAEVPFTSQVYDGTVDPDVHQYGYVDRWQAGGSKGEWTTIDYRIELNTPGVADGRLIGWVNGVKAFDREGYLFRDKDHAHQGVRCWRWHYYFGGSWGSPSDNKLYARNFSVWADESVPEM